MRKTLSLLAAVMMTAFVAFASEVTIDFTAQGYANADPVSELTVDGISVVFDQGTHTSQVPKWYNSGTSVRMYTGNTVTISSSVTITKIEIAMGNIEAKFITSYSASVGEIAVDNDAKTLTWTGAANEVTLSPEESGRLYLVTMVVTIDGDVVIPEVKDPYLLSYTTDEFNYTEDGIWESLFVDGAYKSGNFTLAHFGTTEGYPTWNGFAPSIAEKDGDNYAYYSCVAKGGVKGVGTPYTLAFWPEYLASSTPCAITFAEKSVAEEVYFCNATQTRKDIVEGDFNGYVMKENDYVVVKVRGIAAIEEGAYTLTENSVDYYLADFRDGKSFVNEGWEKCELAALGEVYGLVFDMASTATGEYGINTSTYFALDQLKIKKVEETEHVALAFNYGQAIYLNNAAEAEGITYDNPTWEIDLINLTSEDDYDLWFAALIESQSEDDLSGTYDVAEAEASLYVVDDEGNETEIELLSGTLTVELLSKQDVTDEEDGDYTIYTYKVTLSALDADGNEYTYDGTIDEFYYYDAADDIEETEIISVEEALAIIEEVGKTETDVEYSVLGYVVEIKYQWDADHGTATFWINDEADVTDNALYAYSVSPEDEADKVLTLGDYVMVTGKLIKYNNKTPEVNRGSYTIIEKVSNGLEIVDADKLVKVVDGQLVVVATGNVQVYNVNGQLIYNARVNGQTTISTQQGQVFLVRVDDKVAKVVL